MRKDVRKVKVLYGRYDRPTRDWVYLLTSSFETLEEMTFAVDKERGGLGVRHVVFGSWWGCVEDAVREGLYSDPARNGRRNMRLRVEDGEWGMEEVVYL